MIIRNGGGNRGIKEYLEEGRKVDRHLSRDELDKRVPIEGDLVVTQAVIDTIPDNNQERYLHITMSFNEPDVDEESIRHVYEQYKKELMTAYGDDEFNIYAEIHWPKVKESYNHNTEEMEPRYPHVHIVIPKKNLLTGGFLNPLGMHEKSLKYIDAIQEKLNRDNGLSSPRDNPRVGSNHYEAALGKYKDKEFGSKNGELKRQIHSAVLSRDIRSIESFKALLSEYGEVKVRNEGKDSQYFAVKVPGDQKYTNLKANIFASAYIEKRALGLEPITDAQIKKRVETWRDIQSREIKYVSNASKALKAKYRAMTLPERRSFLLEREKDYGEKHRGTKNVSRTVDGVSSSSVSRVRARNNEHSNFGFAGGGSPEGKSNLHELHGSDLGYFGEDGESAVGLFLQGNEDDNVLDQAANRSFGLRHNLYSGGGSRGGIRVPVVATDPQSSVLTSLLQAEQDKMLQQQDVSKFANIRKNLDPQHLLAYAQIKYGVDPAKHSVSKAKDGSARIKVGKYNYNVSDFLTKHIGLEWAEASAVLTELYEKQQLGITDRPKAKVVLLDDWRRFRDEIYPKNIKTYDQLKNQIRVSFELGLKSINSEYFARRRAITKDETLTRTDKHYFRSVVILEKLQKVEALQTQITEQKGLSSQVKYPYSTLFYNYSTKNEVVNMKILDKLKAKLQTPIEEGINTIGGRRPMTPHSIPNGAEAVKRAKLIQKLKAKEHEAKELKIKLNDLRPTPQKDGSVAFRHKDHGAQIFVNHPDRLEMNRKTEPDEVGVGLLFALERFGNPLEIKGSAQFKEQIILVAAERDMDITFTDENLNRALEAKRLELGLDPLPGNTMSVPDPELDSSLPLNEAVDKALLASKVAELDAVSADLPYSQFDTALHQQLLRDALDRHEEIGVGFIDDEQVREYAALDVAAFAALNNTPEQQQLSLSMRSMMDTDAYGAFMADNSPAEFQLTVDAAQFIQARGPVPSYATDPDGQAVINAESGAAPYRSPTLVAHGAAPYQNKPENKPSYYVTTRSSEGVEATRWGVDLERAVTASNAQIGDKVELQNRGQTNVEVEVNIYDDQKNVVGTRTETVKRNEWNIDVTEPAFVNSQVQAEPVRFLRPDMNTALEERARLELPAVDRDPMNFTDWTEAASMAARLHADHGNETRSPEYSRNVAAIAIEAHAAIAAGAGGDREFYGNDRAFHEDALLADIAATIEGGDDYYGVYMRDHAPYDLTVAIEEQMGIESEYVPDVENGWDEVRAEQLEEQRRDYMSGEQIAAENEAKNDPVRLAELRAEHDIEIGKTLAAFTDESADLRYYENGALPTREEEEERDRADAEILAGFDADNARDREDAEILAGFDNQTTAPLQAPIAPEPLNFVHNGETATIDLNRFQPQPQVEQPVQAASQIERPAAPEPLNFVHNGEPATIDLTRFQPQAEAEQSAQVEIIHNGEPVTVDMANAGDVAKYTRQLANEVSVQSDRIEHAQQRVGELENMRDNLSADRAPEYLTQLAKEITDGNRAIAGATLIKEQAEESLQKLTDAAPQIERQAAPEPLNFTHNGETATIDLTRFQPQPEVEQSAQVKLSPAVAARVAELQDINANYVNADPEQVFDDIVRQGTLADARMRHEELDSGFVDDDKIREIAGEDLKAFVYLEGKPEQQALALAMGRAMENEHYSSFMADNAPQSVSVTIEASAVVSEQQQTMAPSGAETPTFKDMEL